MKNTILITILIISLSIIPVYASPIDSVTINNLGNDYYVVTVIEDTTDNAVCPMSTKTVTKSKTTYIKDSSGTTLWYVRVTGTFSYGNGTAKCIKATPSSASKHKSWKVSNVSCSKSGATAYAKATGKQYLDNTLINTINEKVSLTCSPQGNFS